MWPMYPFPPNLVDHGITASHYNNKPRVGLGVICLCQPKKYGVECLLLKRGPKFVSPYKWSFPGGRLNEDIEIDDDGERATLIQLRKECGGGIPNGLPPLIHIECYKSGRTFYHVYVLDIDSHSAWFKWQPSVVLEHNSEIDLSANELTLRGNSFPVSKGFCWVDLQTLIEECLAVDVNNADALSGDQLHHGLIRWMRANGETILKTLLARSPNLAYHRRHLPTSSTAPNSLSPLFKGPSHPITKGNHPRIHANHAEVPSYHHHQHHPVPPSEAYINVNPFLRNLHVPIIPDYHNAIGDQQQLPHNSATNMEANNSKSNAGGPPGPPPIAIPQMNYIDTSNHHVKRGGHPNGIGPSDHEGVPADNGGNSQRPRRQELCKNYMISGLCPFGDKCWFIHPNTKSNDPTILLPGQPPTILYPPGINHHPYGHADYCMPQPPLAFRSSMGPGVSPSWQYRHPVVPLMHPTNVPFIAAPNPLPLPPQIPSAANSFFYNNPNIINPVLKFKLLSEIFLTDFQVTESVTHLVARADHLYLSIDDKLNDYRILFGGDRKYNDSHNLSGKQSFQRKVACLHISRIISYIVIIGLVDGSVMCWDPRKNTSSPITFVHESTQDDCTVTALIHFTTTIDGAQVVVAGSEDGRVAWYIAQPPMKMYAILSSSQEHSPHKVVSLQIIGGCLISGSSDGIICLWNMRSHQPLLTEKFQAHDANLLNIFTLDTTSFLTVGFNKPLHSASENDTANPNQSNTPHPISCAIIWDYSKSVKRVKMVEDFGDVLVTALHQQPFVGNQFLALGFNNGAVKIYNIPSFCVASEIQFPDVITCDCLHIALNLSREKDSTHNFNMRNPFRDLILTTVWSNGRVLVCQIDPQRNS